MLSFVDTLYTAEMVDAQVSKVEALMARYSEVVEQLSRRECFEVGHDDYGEFFRPRKLSLDKWYGCRGIEILYQNALEKELLPAGYPKYVCTFDCGLNDKHGKDGQLCGTRFGAHGMQFWCKCVKQAPQQCTTKVVQSCFSKIIDVLRCGWREALLSDYPDIMFGKSEDEYCLFVKEKSLRAEDTLMGLLIRQFRLKTIADCFRDPNTVYLLIRKSDVARFQACFNLKISSKV